MTKNRWRESLQCLCQNHIDPRIDEQLKLSKSEVQNKVSKTLKPVKDRRPNKKNRNGEGNSKREAELIELVEDLNRQCQFIYDLHIDLRKQLAQTYNDITDEGFYTASSSSDSDSESSNDRTVESSRQESMSSQLIEAHEQLMSKDQENSMLKDEVDTLLGKINKLEKMVKDYESQIMNMKNDVNRVGEDRSYMSSQMEVLTREVNHLQQEMDVKRTDEFKMLYEEKEVIQEKLLELESMIAAKDDEIFKLNKKVFLAENEASTKVGLLTTERNTLQQELTIMREKISHLENQNLEMKNRVLDEQMRGRNQEDTINSLRADCKLAKGALLQVADKKMDEMAEEFRKSFEANIKMLVQRIRVAEEVQCENKESCKRIKRKAQAYSQMIVKLFDAAGKMLDEMESFVSRFEDIEGDFMKRTSMIMGDIVVMKSWVKVTASEMKPDHKSECESPLVVSADGDELKEKLQLLEVRIVKEKGHKVRLLRGMYDLQTKIAELEKMVAEKEEETLKIGEEKKEAIRQLCISVEYHHSRCDQLVKLLASSSNKSRRRF